VIDSCTEFDVQTFPPSLIFDLPALTPLSYVMMSVDGVDGVVTYDSVDVYALDAA